MFGAGGGREPSRVPPCAGACSPVQGSSCKSALFLSLAPGFGPEGRGFGRPTGHRSRRLLADPSRAGAGFARATVSGHDSPNRTWIATRSQLALATG